MKKLLSVAVLITALITTSSSYVSAKPISSLAAEEEVEIEVRAETDDMTNPKSTRPKAPRVPIFITLNDNTISWNICCGFIMVQFVDKNSGLLLHEEYVPLSSHFVYIPSYITGELIIRLYNGNSWYVGELIIIN